MENLVVRDYVQSFGSIILKNEIIKRITKLKDSVKVVIIRINTRMKEIQEYITLKRKSSKKIIYLYVVDRYDESEIKYIDSDLIYGSAPTYYLYLSDLESKARLFHKIEKLKGEFDEAKNLGIWDHEVPKEWEIDLIEADDDGNLFEILEDINNLGRP